MRVVSFLQPGNPFPSDTPRTIRRRFWTRCHIWTKSRDIARYGTERYTSAAICLRRCSKERLRMEVRLREQELPQGRAGRLLKKGFTRTCSRPSSRHQKE